MTALVSQYVNVVPEGTKQRGTRCQLGTTAENDAYTGTAGELTFDTELENIRVHDGVNAGGGTTLGVQSGAYGTITWEQELTEKTTFHAAADGGADGFGRVSGAPKAARGTTRASAGGAGRTNSRSVTLGTDGSITFTGNRTRAMLVVANVTLRQDDQEATSTCGLHLYRNGSPIPGAEVYSDVLRASSAEFSVPRLGLAAFALTAVVEMKPNDTVQLFVSNLSNSAPVTLYSGLLTIHSL